MKFALNYSILFWVRKNAKTSNGKLPLYCRLTINGQRTEIAMGISVEPNSFNRSSGYLKGGSGNASLINATIDEMKASLRKIYFDSLEQNLPVTPEMVRDMYLGKSINQKTLIEAIKWHNDNFSQKVKSGNKASGTLLKYNTTLEKVKAFVKWNYKQCDLPMANIKADFPDDFEHYLTVHDKLSHNTVMKHIKNLKKVFIIAVQKEWISRNPIAGFRCTYHNPVRNMLLEDDLKRLIKTPMPVKRLDEVRDCFVFMCYTGFAFQDAANLGPDNIQLKIDGKRWLVKSRTKTGSNESVPILQIPDALIAKYRDHPYCVATNRLLPFNSNQRMNSYLKEIGAICKINFDLTTHLARHTFATTVTLSNGVPLETVQVLLGHQSIKTTQIYAKVVAQKVSYDMDMLQRKLNPVATKKQKAK